MPQFITWNEKLTFWKNLYLSRRCNALRLRWGRWVKVFFAQGAVIMHLFTSQSSFPSTSQFTKDFYFASFSDKRRREWSGQSFERCPWCHGGWDCPHHCHCDHHGNHVSLSHSVFQQVLKITSQTQLDHILGLLIELFTQISNTYRTVVASLNVQRQIFIYITALP